MLTDLHYRRGFLKTSTSAILGATSLANMHPLLGAETDRPDKTRNKRKAAQRTMTLGFSSYGMKTLKTESVIDVLSDIGYQAIEITVWPGWDAQPINVDKARRKAIRARLLDKNLVLTSLMEHMTPSAQDSENKRHLERLKAVFELAAELAPHQKPVVQTVLGGGKWESKKNLFVDRAGQWSELGRQFGIVTCIKPHRGGAMSRPSEAIWIIKQLNDSRWLRMVYDYSHYIFRDISLKDSIKQSIPYTAHVAIKDAAMTKGRIQFELPGQVGTTDFETLIRLFHEGGYVGDISCEVSGQVWSQPKYDPIAAARTCFKNIQPLFQQATI